MRRIGSETHSARRSRFVIGHAIAVIERGARRSVLVKCILRLFMLLLGRDDAHRGHQHCYSEPDLLGFVTGERLF